MFSKKKYVPYTLGVFKKNKNLDSWLHSMLGNTKKKNCSPLGKQEHPAPATPIFKEKNTCKFTKLPYFGPWAKIYETKDILFPSTFEIWENKMHLVFSILA